MRVRIVDRLTDNHVLEWVKLRQKGKTSTYIGDWYGVTSAKVRVATNRVRDADIKASGELARAAYW